MNFDTKKEKPSRLNAFVGRSFLDEDKSVWHELRDIFDSLKPMGFEYEDAKEAQIRPISEKVKELIIRNDIYIGILTKRYPIWQIPSSWYKKWFCPLRFYVSPKWTSSEWVVEEIGFAIGKDRKVLLLIENDVIFPTSDLDGDTQWISFNRKNLAASHSEINQMILNLISQRVTSKIEPTSVTTAPPINIEETTVHQEPSFYDQVQAIQRHVLSGNFDEADEIQKKIIESPLVSHNPPFFEIFLLGIRAKSNDTTAFDRLKEKCKDNSNDVNAVVTLSEVFSSFGQFTQATKLLISHLNTVPQNQRSKLAIKASQELCKDGKPLQAISLLLETLQKESDESKYISIYLEMANSSEKAKLPDLEAAFLEKVLKLAPSDNNARFRLALVYSKNNLDQLAAYHGAVVVEHTDWPSASNNLAVVYGNLGFKANEFKLFKSVADQYALAKANIAVLYEVAGLLSDAEILAKNVLSIEENDNDSQLAINRARYVLNEINAKIKNEGEAIKRIADDTKNEREFMSSYAEAYCASALSHDKGIFTTPHGDMEITREGASLKGEGIVTQITPRGDFYSILLNVGSVEPETTTYLLSLTAQLHGQSGTYELKVTPREKSHRFTETLITKTTTGLLFFENNGDIIQFLECDEKKRIVNTARRKNS